MSLYYLIIDRIKELTKSNRSFFTSNSVKKNTNNTTITANCTKGAQQNDIHLGTGRY